MKVFPAAAPNMIIYPKRFLWLFSYTVAIEKPRIRYSTGGQVPCWVCANGSGYSGFGRTPRQAWDDWAYLKLI